MKTQILIAFLFLISISIFGQNDTTGQNEDQEIELIMVLETMPKFVGGYEALYRYVNSNAIYTENARKEKVTGKVFISFWVEKDGSISEPKILRGLHPDLDSISLNLVKNMPKWIPATQRGQTVKCRFNLPIEFSFDQSQNSNNSEPSKYWRKKGKKKFMKTCTQEFRKSKTECDCWYNFIILNYNNRTLKTLDIKEIFEKQKCK